MLVLYECAGIKVSKSKLLMATLEKVHEAGRLHRFVVDEAHCCSQASWSSMHLSLARL
jgi:superfamily II DNA helicase RecQ